MKLRLIAGRLGGRVIQAPDGFTTHPMSERVRGSLFNIIGSELLDAEVLDAFAGSGAVGLEAISRGARSVQFVDRDRVASRMLAENIESLGLGEEAKSTRASLSSWIDGDVDKTYDLIFADPPYNDLQLSTVSKLVGLLKPNGLMILSYPGRCELPTVNGVVVVDNRSYGNAALAFYRQKQIK